MSEKQQQHEFLISLKSLADNLGRSPSRDESLKHIPNYRAHIKKFFGTHSNALLAAGLELPKNSPINKKGLASQDVFSISLEKHFEKYKPPDINKNSLLPRTLVIPDTHFPFAHAKTLEKIYRFAESFNPDLVIQIGDLFDFFSSSKFPRSHNIFLPKDETHLARRQAEEMWSNIQSVSPNARKIQMVGNHDIRPLRRTLEALPIMEDWIERALREMLTFPNVETVFDHREPFYINDSTIAVHGFSSRHGAHRDHSLMNVVLGHLHVGGVSCRQIRGQILWELNAGHAADANAPGLTYTPSRIVGWTLGFGAIDEYGPRFIPASEGR